MKKILSWFLSILMVLTMMPGTTVFAEDETTVLGMATDATTILKIDNKTLSLDNSWTIDVIVGTLKGVVGDDLTSDVTLTGLPAGLTYNAAKSGTNDIRITLSGEADTALTADAAISAVVKGSAVTEVGALDSEAIGLELWVIGPGTTFVLSNESGGNLIDKLIAAGYGDDCLYDVLEMLQPYSNGVITDRFLKTLRSCPIDSEIFDPEAALRNFAGLNNPVGVNVDGTMIICAIYGKDYWLEDGYNTYLDRQVDVGLEAFTNATDQLYYILAGEHDVSIPGLHYKAFAIAWAPRTEQSFVLSNENGDSLSGGLIDKLIAAGHGSKSLYEVLQILKPSSNGVITDAYMAKLAACPLDSDIFTAELNNFASETNSPIGINSDGTLIVASFYGRDFNSRIGYTTTEGQPVGVGNVLFTHANNIEYYVEAGSNTDDGVTIIYEVFAVAWASLKVTGSATDSSITMSLGNVTVSSDNTWEMNVSTGTLKGSVGGDLTSDITVSGLPSGLTYAAEKGEENNILITVAGTAASQVTAETTISVVIKGSTVSDIGATDSDVINVKVYPSALIGEATTVVLSNEEGGLIDDLIKDEGYRNSNLYQALVGLAPSSGGVISDEFLDTLAMCPAGSDIFTAKFSDFAGLNNPVSINSDGTLSIQAIYGRDYYGKTGYATYPENPGTGREVFTYALSPQYYIDAGGGTGSAGTTNYKAFAIAWSPVKVTGSATDSSVTMSSDNITVSADHTWEMNLATGTLMGSSGDDLTGDITVSGLPGGLTYVAKKGEENNILITVAGTVASQITAETTVSVVIKGSAVSDIAAADSDIISVKIYPSSLAGDATTFVLSNEEGGLIDDLIAKGFGSSNLYQALVSLAPTSGGVITDEFIETLALCPAGSEIFTAELSNFAGGVYNPVCINSDGTVTINAIIGRDYYGKTGYDTYPESQVGDGSEMFTYATSPQYYIDAGSSGSGTGSVTNYKAFAIAWSPNQEIEVCRIGSTPYATLDDALAVVQDGETITLLQNIDYHFGISISGKGITFDLNGYDLDVTNTSGSGLETGGGGSIAMIGTGQFNVTGSTYGVYAHDGGVVTVTGAGSSEAGSTSVQAASGGKITVAGDVNGLGGAFATGTDSTILVNGSITATDTNSSGAWASSGGKIVIDGNVQGGIYGTHAIGSNSIIQVGGNVTATGIAGTGAYAESAATVNIAGNVQGIGYGVIALSGSSVFVGGNVYSGAYGVVARSGGEITIDGVIAVGAGSAIAIGSGTHSLITPTTKVGYLTYSDGESTVWLKDSIATLQVAGTATDATTILKMDNKTLSLDNTWTINVSSGTVKGVEGEDLTTHVTLNGLPAGLTYTAKKVGANNISITLSGEANTALTADVMVSAIIKGSAVTETGAQDSEAIVLDLWYIGTGTTIVITNEGGLIDKLVIAGYGDDCLYDVLEVLQPQSDGVLTDRFLKILKSCPADSEMFDDEAALHNFSGLNNPICINLDGAIRIQPIFAGDYFGKEGYFTSSSTQIGVGQELFTHATAEEYFIDAGSTAEVGRINYRAFAVIWAANLPTVTTDALGLEDVTSVSANLSGSVTTDNALPITERGFVYSETSNPTLSAGTKVMAGSGIGSFTTSLSGLTAGTAYHVSAYAISIAGIAYGEDRSFTTSEITNHDESGGNQQSDQNVNLDTTATLPDEQLPLGNLLFTDVAGHWAEDEIYDLVRKGIINGYDDHTFRPDSTITRAEYADMLVKALNLEPKRDKTFADITGHWAQDSIETAASYGIVKGYNESTFGPDDVIQREQLAAMVARAMEIIASTQAGSIFIDAATISDWAKLDVDAVVEEQWMVGYPDHTFRPHGNTTRAEAVSVIYNILLGSHD